MANGYMGKFLDVDLTKQEFEDLPLSEELTRDYIGGYGIGVKILFDRMKPNVDALGPDNILGLLTGPMTGTPCIEGNRFVAVCKSPLTGTWGDANCGGTFGPHMKFAGYDGLLFTGIAENPTYLLIEDGEASLHDASDLWGLDSNETEDILIDRHGRGTQVASIGQAGENLSLIACIMNDKGRAAGRSGVGAVMGSKKLKAVVVKGKAQVPIPNITKARETRRRMLKEANEGLYDFFHGTGTLGLTSPSAMSGDSPVKNWGGVGVVELVDQYDMSGATGPAVNASMEKKYACWHCPVACGAESIDGSDRGEFAFPKGTHRPEYETMGAFGTMSGNNNLDSLIAFNHWCNQYGLDTISTGATISFAIECYENGLLTKEDTDGIEMTWGNASSILQSLHAIGRREDGLGDLLADGSKVAAERISQGSEQYAVQIDGEELPMHDPKLDIGFGASYTLDPTPGRHTIWSPGNSVKFEGMPQLPEDKMQAAGRGPRHKVAHEFSHAMNSAGMCYFVTTMAPSERLPEWINLVTGWDMTPEELMEAGERIGNLRMAFAVKHGNNPAGREVLGRIIGDPPQTAGPLEGVTVDVDTMRKEWFEEAGWDPETSVPSRDKLESLGLADVADALGV